MRANQCHRIGRRRGAGDRTGDRTVLRVGTRGSALALAQSGAIAAVIAEKAGAGSELVRVKTEGDINTGPLAAIGGTGIFVTAVRAALADGRVDVIVHSFKDLPTAPAPGLTLAAVPERENPFDALCARDGLTLDTLPPGARVGHRVAAAGGATPAPPPGPACGTGARQRRYQAAVGQRRRSGRSRAGRRRADPAGPDRRDHRDVRARRDAAGPGAGCARRRMPDHRRRDSLVRGRCPGPGQPRGAGRRRSRNAPCWPRWRPVASPRSAPTPPSPHGTLTLRAAVIAVDGSSLVGGERSGSVDDAAAIGRDLATELLSRGAADLLGAAR